MSVIKIENKSYTVEPLYQWDTDQVLEIRGLSLARVPEIHFSNVAMSRALVRPATMDVAGVIRVGVPNSLLQTSAALTVYLCDYEGSTFQTLYKLDIPVKARTKPEGYTFQDDAGEIYSFEALENMVYNAVYTLDSKYAEFTEQMESRCKSAESAALTSAVHASKAANSAAEAAAEAAAAAVTEALDAAILKSDIVEIVKVSELPAEPDSAVLYVVV